MKVVLDTLECTSVRRNAFLRIMRWTRSLELHSILNWNAWGTLRERFGNTKRVLSKVLLSGTVGERFGWKDQLTYHPSTPHTLWLVIKLISAGREITTNLFKYIYLIGQQRVNLQSWEYFCTQLKKKISKFSDLWMKCYYLWTSLHVYSTGQKKPNRERCAERVLKAFCFAFPKRSPSVPLAFPKRSSLKWNARECVQLIIFRNAFLLTL